MSSFHDIRLPIDVEQGATGGPRFMTHVFELSSGYEKRNSNWSRSRGKWDIGFGIDSKDEHEAVVTFFYGRRGRAYGFRFRDWTDYHLGDSATDTPQVIGTADGLKTKFQIFRRYDDGLVTFDRAITRPVDGTIRVFVGAVEQLSGVSVDYSTGIITFTSAPSASAAIGVIGQFDVPVRFGSDDLNLQANTADDFTIPGLSVVEIREALGSLS